MDLSGIEVLVPILAGAIGVEATTLIALIGLIVAISNLTGRLIPDDAEGALGWVRKVAKVFGMYASNRVSKGVKTNDVVSEIVGARVKDEVTDHIEEMAGQAEALIPEVIKDPFRRGAEAARFDEDYRK